MADTAKDKQILMGRIGAAHGLKGEVRLQSFTADPEAIAAYSPLLTKSGAELTIEKVRPQKSLLIARIKGISDRTAAESLNGTELFVPRHRLIDEGDEDEFFQADLIGLETRLADGTQHGTILAVHNYGADDVLEVRTTEGRVDLLPFTKAVVPEVKIADGYAVVVPPEEVIGEDR